MKNKRQPFKAQKPLVNKEKQAKCVAGNFKQTKVSSIQKSVQSKIGSEIKLKTDEIILFEPSTECQLKNQSVVKLKAGHGLFSGVPNSVVKRGKCIVESIQHENRLITTRVCGKIFSVPFSQIEGIIQKPAHYYEPEFSAIGAMLGFYCYQGSDYYIRWFSKYSLLANFVATQPMSELIIEVKQEKLFKMYYRNMVRAWKRQLERYNVTLKDYSLDPVVSLDDEMKVMLNLLSDYIVYKEYRYCTVKEYIQSVVLRN